MINNIFIGEIQRTNSKTLADAGNFIVYAKHDASVYSGLKLFKMHADKRQFLKQSII